MVMQNVKQEEDVIRLHSRVKVKEKNSDKVIEMILVAPEEADIRQRRVSVATPAGAALMGFREGEEVMWNVPSGKKTFQILEVINPE